MSTTKPTANKPQSEDLDPSKWVELYGDYLFRFAMQRVRSRETAEDLVQDTLISAYKALESFEGRAAVKTWLVSILRNKIIDYVRRGKRVQFVSLEGMSEQNTADDSFNRLGIWKRVIPSWGMDQDTIVESKAFMKQLKSCMDALPESMQSVFALRTIEQLSTKEICDSLDISENNVWVILHRARSRVRDCLEANWLNS